MDTNKIPNAVTRISSRRKPTSRHRFNNKLAFVLTTTTLVMLAVLSIMYGDNKMNNSSSSSSDALSSNRGHVPRWLEDAKDDDSNGEGDDDDDTDYSSFSCRYLFDQVPDAGAKQCLFARTCNEGEGIWAPWVFCSSYMGVYTAFAVLSPVVLLWMVTLFRLLGSTAEDFFSCSLEMFAVKLGLPPRFAGVTLLALGNGAADVSATISAITSDEENGYELSLGALTGAAMFVGAVVSGVVILVADGVPCRGALIRDVTALVVTVGIIWSYLSAGVITRSTTTVFLGLYGFFVCLVLAADVYHRAVVLPRMARVAAAITDAQREGGNESTTGEGPPPNAFMRFVTSVSNYDNSCLRNDTTEATITMTPAAAQQEVGSASVSQLETVPSAIGDAASATNNADEEPIILHGQNGILTRDNRVHAPTSSMELETDREGGGNYTLVEDHIDRVCVGEGSLGIPSYNWSGAFYDGRQEITNELIELWNEILDLKLYERVLLYCELPFTVARKVRKNNFVICHHNCCCFLISCKL
jgi:hypothetical protein